MFHGQISLLLSLRFMSFSNCCCTAGLIYYFVAFFDQCFAGDPGLVFNCRTACRCCTESLFHRVFVNKTA